MHSWSVMMGNIFFGPTRMPHLVAQQPTVYCHNLPRYIIMSCLNELEYISTETKDHGSFARSYLPHFCYCLSHDNWVYA